jgi:hypothetical protein
MRGLKKRTPRIAGLLALVLGAVALLALAGVAVAKNHGNDDNGNHGRHHHHGRHHQRVLEMHESGTISSFDATTGKLTITQLDGDTVTGLVTDATEIKCEGVDDRLGRRDHGSGDNSGSGSGGQVQPGDDHGGRGNEPGDDNGGHGNEPGDDNGGQNEPGDDHGGRGNEPGDDNGGEVAAGSTCTVDSLVPGAVVDEAELRIEGGTATFEEIELGHNS